MSEGLSDNPTGQGIDLGSMTGQRPSRRTVLKASGMVAAAAAVSGGGVLTGAAPAHAAIAHPGMLHTEEDFARMRDKVAAGEQPWKSAWDQLVVSRNSQSSWGPRPASVVNRGTWPDNCGQLYNDAAAVYQNALRWKISGDVAHADAAVAILNAWGSTLTAITGDASRYLAAGLHGHQLANGAEIMRTYPGWAAADIARFQQMMADVFYPMNRRFLVEHNDANPQNYWANWDLCSMASILAIGILCDDQAKIDEALEYFEHGAGNGSINHAVPILHSPTLGQWQESGRDQEHTLMGVGLMADFCEMAWNQGYDLYGYGNNRFLAGAEYVARYNNLKPVPFAFYSWRTGQGGGAPQTHFVVSDKGHGATRSIWDTVVGHYAHRLGLHIPEVEEKAAATRPDGGPSLGMHASKFDHLGFTTLTHFRGPVATKVPTGVYLLTARHSDQVISARGDGTANGTLLEQRSIDDLALADGQQWVLEDLGSGRYRLLDAVGGRAVDITDIATRNGAPIQLWDYWGGDNQKFTVTSTGAGHFRLMPVHSGKCVAVGGASVAEGTGLIQWHWTGGPEQQWRLTAGSTVRRLRLATSTDRYVRHYGFRAHLATHPFPAQDSEFRVVTGLAGLAGVSFESINFPDRHLRVRTDGSIGVDPIENSTAYRESATFRRTPGLADGSMYSYQLWNDPARYLTHRSGLIDAVEVADPDTEVNATFAEVPASLGF